MLVNYGTGEVYEELFAAESLLLGRVTYQGFAAAWPNMGGDDFGQRMNSIHKYVVSSTWPMARRRGATPRC
jgi:dihydrofolate reductase